MIRLLSVAIVAGLISESTQQKSDSSKFFPFPFFPIKPGSGWPCYFPTHLRESFSLSTECWTEWFDRDDPSGTGDWETLLSLRMKYPGKICPKPMDIEATTLSGVSSSATGDTFSALNPTVGLICKNQDQKLKKCNDYRVRFSCHPPFCGGGICWTKWYDRDDPSGSGDWELLSNLRKENPGQICANPLYIEAVTIDTLTPAVSTGEVFYIFNPSQGFVCRKKDQKDGKCRDYKVRFGCPC